MYITDYHLHTKYSYDSKEEPCKICDKAIDLQLKEIAFTDHMDIFTNERFDNRINLEQRAKELKKLQNLYDNKLTIVNGIELGQPQANTEEADKFYKSAEFDFIIGSIHNLKNDTEIEFYQYTFDNCHQFYDNYMDDLIELALNFDFDVLGHITLPLRYMPIEISSSIDIALYEEKYRYLFSILTRQNKGIELNTSGLRKGNGETSPSPQVLKWYKECGGEIITIGSDAHSEKNVGFGLNVGYEILKNVGFSYIATYKGRNKEYKSIK